MAKRYVYTDHKTKKTLFTTVEPNYVSMNDVDKKASKKIGRDPRLDRTIERRIVVVPDVE